MYVMCVRTRVRTRVPGPPTNLCKTSTLRVINAERDVAVDDVKPVSHVSRRLRLGVLQYAPRDEVTFAAQQRKRECRRRALSPAHHRWLATMFFGGAAAAAISFLSLVAVVGNHNSCEAALSGPFQSYYDPYQNQLKSPAPLGEESTQDALAARLKPDAELAAAFTGWHALGDGDILVRTRVGVVHSQSTRVINLAWLVGWLADSVGTGSAPFARTHTHTHAHTHAHTRAQLSFLL
jgi:hypothetical protein